MISKTQTFSHDPECGGTFTKWIERFEDAVATHGSRLSEEERARVLVMKLDTEVYNLFRDHIRPQTICREGTWRIWCRSCQKHAKLLAISGIALQMIWSFTPNKAKSTRNLSLWHKMSPLVGIPLCKWSSDLQEIKHQSQQFLIIPIINIICFS